MAFLLGLASGCSCGGSPSVEPGIDAGRDAGVDAGREAGPDAGPDASHDAGPWIPEPPRRLTFDEGVTCDPVAPAADGAPPPVPEGEVPRLLWQLAPFSDEAGETELVAAGYDFVYIAELPMTLMDDGDLVFSVNGASHYAIDATGAFAWHIGYARSEPVWRAPAAGIGDWLVTRHAIGFISWPTGVSGGGSGPGTVLDIPRGGDAVVRSPVAVARTGEVVAAGGVDRLLGGCVDRSELRWMVEYDTSRLGDGWYRFTHLLDDGSVLFAPGSPALYRFDQDGEILRSHVPEDGIVRHVVGHVPGCGIATMSARVGEDGGRVPTFELYTEDLERVSTFDIPGHTSFWHHGAMPDCGFVHFVEIEGDRDVEPFEGIVRLDAGGTELWRYPVTEIVRPMIPLADGGLLLVDSDMSGQRVTYLSAAGEVVWRYDIDSDLPTGAGAAIPTTGMLAPNGVFYLGISAAVGETYYVIAVATGVTPAPMAWYASGGNPRRTSHSSWE